MVAAPAAMVAMAAMSAAASTYSAVSSSNAAKSQAKIQRSQDELALSEQERDSQNELAKTLAARNNMFAATGTDPTGGSALSVMNADKTAADRTLNSIEARRSLVGAAYQQAVSGARNQMIGGITGSLLKLGMSTYTASRMPYSPNDAYALGGYEADSRRPWG